MSADYYRRDGTPYDMMDWARDFENMVLRRVAEDNLPNGVRVSTVWLGLNHNYFKKGRPLIFETMVFAGSWTDLDCWRYSTEEEALRGHKTLVKKWKTRKTADEILNETPKQK